MTCAHDLLATEHAPKLCDDLYALLLILCPLLLASYLHCALSIVCVLYT